MILYYVRLRQTPKKGTLYTIPSQRDIPYLLHQNVLKKFDQVLKRRVMRSGNVGKIYTPKDFIDRDIFIVLPRRKKNELNSFL